MMKSKEFVEKLKLAAEVKTLYVLGGFGAPLNEANKKRYANRDDYNRGRADMINAATDDTFAFDCVCLLKGILWGWNADKTKTYGGAVYKANDVPDMAADSFSKTCKDLTSDFSMELTPGEIVWIEGHIGAYIGDGLVVESTPKWKNGAQITALGNKGGKAGYNSRKWTKHGHLPYVDYTDQQEDEPVFKVGDVVSFVGNMHYTNANAVTGKSTKPGIATLTEIYKLGKSKHPYHCVRVDTKQTNVWGWVDEADVQKYVPEEFTEPTKECQVTIHVVKRGNCGAEVKKVQHLLGIAESGNFDAYTEQQVKEFQLSKALEVDGSVGPETWKALIMK